MKVNTSQLSTSTSLAGKPPVWIRPVPLHPMGILLFGKRPPRLLDRRRYPKLARILQRLEGATEQVAELVGRIGERFPIELCEGTNAHIFSDGVIAFGVDLLERYEQDDELLLAILGHEIGHRPWSWPRLDLSRLSRARQHLLYREEEAKADRFTGLALAELGASPASVCGFLLERASFEREQPPDYYPAEVRAQMIRESFERRLRALRAGQAVFGDLRARARQLR